MSEIVVALHSFNATEPEELSLHRGEIYYVIRKDEEYNDGWWEGRDKHGRIGLFPASYTSRKPYSLAQSERNVEFENVEPIKNESGDKSMDTAFDDLKKIVKQCDEKSAQLSETPTNTKEPPVIEDVKSWSPENVADYLSGNGLKGFYHLFIDNHIHGEVFLNLDHQSLKEIGITSFGHRWDILKLIQEIKSNDRSNNFQSASSHDASVQPLSIAYRTSNIGGEIVKSADSSFGNPYLYTQDNKEGLKSMYRTSFDKDWNLPSLIDFASIGDSEYKIQKENLRSTVPNSAPLKNVQRRSASLNSAKLGFEKSLGPHSVTRDRPQYVDSTEKIESDNGKQSRLSIGDEVLNYNKGRMTENVRPVSNATSGSSIGSDKLKKSITRKFLGRSKTQPSGIVEGLRRITSTEASKEADFSGWMKKRGETLGVWKNRYFVLKGSRLSYFYSEDDTSEKGLIDITSHRIAIVENFVYGAKYVIKMMPPAPGAARAVTFTPPKDHYFALENKEMLKRWHAAFLKVSIGRDLSAPVMSTSRVPTISLAKAREMHLRPPQQQEQQKKHEQGSHQQFETNSKTNSTVTKIENTKPLNWKYSFKTNSKEISDDLMTKSNTDLSNFQRT